MLPSGKSRGPSLPGREIMHPHSGSYGLLAEGSFRYPTISVPCLGEANSVWMRIWRSRNSGSSYSRSTGFRGSRAINSRGIAVNLLLFAGKRQPLQRTGKDRWCADGILSRNGNDNRVCTRLRLPHPRPQVPDDIGEDLPGVASDAALHCHVAVETAVTQRTEGPGEVRVTRSWLETVAVGEVDVGEMPLCPADGLAEVVLLDIHVKEVAHHFDRRAPNGLAEFDFLLHAVEHVILVAVERLEEHESSLIFCMLSQLLQGVEQHAPILFFRAGHFEGREPFGGEAESRRRDGAGASQLGYA